MESKLVRIVRHATAGIIWQTEISSFMSGELITLVGQVEQKCCTQCKRQLSDIHTEETWTYVKEDLYCDVCYTKSKVQLLEKLAIEEDMKKVMPRRIDSIKLEITSHRNFNKLSLLEKMQVDECIANTDKKIARQRDDNSYLRGVWRHLYFGEPL